MFKKCFLALLPLALMAGGAEKPYGGVSVDLSVLKGISADGNAAPNLIQHGDFESPEASKVWKGGVWVWQRGSKDAAHRQKIGKMTQRFLAKGWGVNGSGGIRLYSPESIQQERNTDGTPDVASTYRQVVGVADSTQPTKFLLSCDVKGKSFKTAGSNSLRLFVDFYDTPPEKYGYKRTRAGINQAITIPANWEKRTFSFVAPPHTRKMDIRFSYYGLGDVRLDNVKLQECTMTKGLTATVVPWELLDNTYCIQKDQIASISVLPRNEAGVKCQAVRLKITVPKGFCILGGNTDTKLLSCNTDPSGVTTAVFDIHGLRGGFPKDGYGIWRRPYFMVQPSLPVSEKLYPLTYQILDKNYASPVKTLNLKVIAPVTGKVPSKFVSGILISHEFNYQGENAQKAAQFIRRAGFNSLHGGSDDILVYAKKAGLVRYNQPHYLCNGYRLGTAKNRTEESYFRQMDGKPFKRSMVKTCPYEVYTRGKFYRSEVLGMLKKILVSKDEAEQIQPNWEPYYLDYKGCFCDRCREEFVKFMAGKADAATIRAKWPKDVVATWENQWIRFRSWQHGKLCVTLEEDINAIGKSVGKDSHFLPEIAWSAYIDSTNPRNSQYSVLDFLEKLPWHEPWGPYIFSSFTEKYNYYPGIHLITWNAAKDIKKFVRNHVKNPAKRPKLVAMPHGWQCGTWITEPEALAFEYFCFFLNGWEGVMAYYFPQCYDHRYWSALAETNSGIAAVEKYVLDGKEADKDLTVTPLTALPQPFFPAFWSEGGNFKKRLPDLEKSAIIQGKAYRSGDSLMAAVGNFWMKGECFAKIQFRNLKPAANYAVKEVMPGGKSLGTFSGTELAKGITVRVGALRWNLLTVTPGKAKAELTQSQTMALLKTRKPVIDKACAEEKAFAQKVRNELASDMPVNDFKAVYELNAAGVSLKAVKEAGKDYLQIKAANYTALVDPSVAGRIFSLKIRGKEQVFASGSCGMGVDAVWWPNKLAWNSNKGYKITGMNAVKQGIDIELTRQLSRMDKPLLARVKIVKHYLFTPNGYTVKTTFTNGTAADLSFAFRFHNLPMQLKDPKGMADFAGKAQFQRELALKMARFGAPDTRLDKAYSVSKFIDVPGVSAMTLKGNCGTFRLTFSPNIYGIIFWDAGTFSTMEPLYKAETLVPGKSATYSATWNF